jgi:orotate phosphoribosyltransferase
MRYDEKGSLMSSRAANVTDTRRIGSRDSTNRKNRPMLQAVAAPKPLSNFSKEKDRLLEIIKQKSLLLEGGPFKLASGAMSDYYLDMKPTTFNPEGLTLIAEIICDLLKDDLDVDSIGGLELGAVPVITAVCQRSWLGRPINGFVVRKEKKGHGTDKKIDGNFKPNTTVVLFDDVTTRGGSVMDAVKAVREKGATVKKIITIVDRLEGAAQNLRKEGIDLVPIFTTRDLLRKQ